jgi:hypothetical protein
MTITKIRTRYTGNRAFPVMKSAYRFLDEEPKTRMTLGEKKRRLKVNNIIGIKERGYAVWTRLFGSGRKSVTTSNEHAKELPVPGKGREFPDLLLVKSNRALWIL